MLIVHLDITTLPDDGQITAIQAVATAFRELLHCKDEVVRPTKDRMVDLMAEHKELLQEAGITNIKVEKLVPFGEVESEGEEIEVKPRK
jgi:hypothetical protein